MTTGPLTGAVLEYDRVMTQLVPTVKRPADWEPLTRFVAVRDFERIETFLEVQDWDTYAEMLSGWAQSTRLKRRCTASPRCRISSATK